MPPRHEGMVARSVIQSYCDTKQGWYSRGMNEHRVNMSIRASLLFVIAIGFSLALNVYLRAHALLNKDVSGTRLTTGNECTDDPHAYETQKTNPNKMLFISCGGFLE